MNIALIIGGLSAEREVSLLSGKGILKSLRRLGHNVSVIDPVYGSKKISEDIIFKDEISKDYPTQDKLKKLWGDASRKMLECVNSDLFDDIDIAFIGLHGKYGEDGKIQTLLELRGIKYTGSDIISSSIAMDKNFSKILFSHYGITTPEWSLMTKKDKIPEGYYIPCVVKPNDEGSTVGLTIVKEKKNFVQALNKAFEYSDKVLIEQYISGREITVAVLDNKAYPVIEVIPKNGFYDYEHKYTKGMTEYVCPAEIPDEISIKAKEYALLAHKALGCSVYSRVDFILDSNGKLFCLEVNTLPGMTELSLVPKSVAIEGIEFDDLIKMILELSLEK